MKAEVHPVGQHEQSQPVSKWLIWQDTWLFFNDHIIITVMLENNPEQNNDSCKPDGCEEPER